MSKRLNYNSAAQSKIQLSKPEIIIILLNFIVCTTYAGLYHNVLLDHPFGHAFETAIRILLYSFAGRVIGNLFWLIGDLCVIGSLSFAIYNIIIQ